MNPNIKPNRPYCTPEDLELEQMVNGHADRRRQSRRDAAFWDKLLGTVIWSVYLIACLILLWGVSLAQSVGLLAQPLAAVVLIALVLGCCLCGYKLAMVWKGGVRS